MKPFFIYNRVSTPRNYDIPRTVHLKEYYPENIFIGTVRIGNNPDEGVLNG